MQRNELQLLASIRVVSVSGEVESVPVVRWNPEGLEVLPVQFVKYVRQVNAVFSARINRHGFGLCR